MSIIRFITQFIIDIFVLCICSSIGFIGLCLILGAVINIRDASIMEHTAFSEIGILKTGQIVKLKAIADPSRTVKTDLSQLPCHFFIKENLKIVMDDGSPVLTVKKVDYKPDNLKIIYNNHKYFINVRDNEALFFIQLEKNYLYNSITKTYRELAKQNFHTKDKLIREKIVLPSEEVMIFGKIKGIKTLANEKIPTIFFEKQKYGNFFESPFNTFRILLDTLLNDKFTLFIISTGPENKITEKINSTLAYLMLVIGVLFFIVPLLIIYTVLIKNMKKLSSLGKKSFS